VQVAAADSSSCKAIISFLVGYFVVALVVSFLWELATPAGIADSRRAVILGQTLGRVSGLFVLYWAIRRFAQIMHLSYSPRRLRWEMRLLRIAAVRCAFWIVPSRARAVKYTPVTDARLANLEREN
jgi:hypothetical protein